MKYVEVWFLDKMWQNTYQKSEDQTAILLTCLPFGFSLAPAKFCVTSETVFDLANDLLYCEQWDPSKLPSPYAELPTPERLDPSTPYAQAEEADVTLDPSITGGA